MSSKAEYYSNSEEFKKISAAILDTYGQEVGISMIVHLIHELEKPVEKQIEYVPSITANHTYPAPYLTGTGTPPSWDWTKVTCADSGTTTETSGVRTAKGYTYLANGPITIGSSVGSAEKDMMACNATDK